jgi:hypothetical protein
MTFRFKSEGPIKNSGPLVTRKKAAFGSLFHCSAEPVRRPLPASRPVATPCERPCCSHRVWCASGAIRRRSPWCWDVHDASASWQARPSATAAAIASASNRPTTISAPSSRRPMPTQSRCTGNSSVSAVSSTTSTRRSQPCQKASKKGLPKPSKINSRIAPIRLCQNVYVLNQSYKEKARFSLETEVPLEDGA